MDENYIRLCRLDELEKGRTRLFSVEGEEMLLTRENDSVYAVQNLCSHDGAPIGEGQVKEGELTCPRHGARFDIKNGRAMSLPAVMSLKSYPVKIVDGEIFVAPRYGSVR